MEIYCYSFHVLVLLESFSSYVYSNLIQANCISINNRIFSIDNTDSVLLVIKDSLQVGEFEQFRRSVYLSR